MSRPLPRLAAALAALSALALSGCAASGGPGADAAGASVDVLVRDGQLRVTGEPCSGARPYQHIHRDSELVLEHGDERLAARLPDGEAVRIDDVDYGRAPRIPTACRFRVELPGLNADVEYRVVIDGRDAGIYRYADAVGDAGTPPIAVPPLADPTAILEPGDD